MPQCAALCRHGHRCDRTDGHPGDRTHFAPDSCTTCEIEFRGRRVPDPAYDTLEAATAARLGGTDG